MKRVFAVLFIVLVLLALSGCSFELKSIETLMRPPLTFTEQELEESIDKFLGNNISLRAPSAGSYHSAITLHDLDGDKNDEAIIFYVDNNDTSAVRMCVLKKNSAGWQCVSNFAGNGSGIYSIDFHDLNNDGCDDMLVSWYLFENKVYKTLTVYSSSRRGNEINFSACVTQPYNLLCVEDMFSTGEKQIVLTYTDSAKASEKTRLQLLSLNKENRVVLLSETNLDDRMISINSIRSDIASDGRGRRILIDALLSDGNLLTEIYVWNNESKSFDAMIPSSLQYAKKATVRTNNLYSFDIDGDGTVEIPKKESLSFAKDSYSSSGYLLAWYDFNGDNFVREASYAVNIRHNYRIFISDELRNKLKINSKNKDAVWSFVTLSGEEVFTISVYSALDWNIVTDKSLQTVIKTAGDTIYTCKTGVKASEYGIEPDEIVKQFSLNS